MVRKEFLSRAESSPSPSLEFENINNIPVHCNEILRQKAMECAIICQASF